MQTTQKETSILSIVENNSSRTKIALGNEDQSYDNSYDLKNLSQQVMSAFAKTERDNDEMITRVKNTRINQIVSAMLQAEKSNDTRLQEMISTLPTRESNGLTEATYGMNGWPSDMVSQLK